MEQSQDKTLDSMLDNVSRKMGRCILRLQQYEILMKRLVAHQELSGYADELEENRATRSAEVKSKTLGQLVGELTGSYLRIEAKPQEQTEEETNDDFENLYKGQVSKSGVAILPSKRTRRIPEVKKPSLADEALSELKAEQPEIKEENLDTEEAPLELSEEAPAEENKPE